jgi:hypothetical protein
MGTKLPEFAVILSIIMLGQRFSGYENRPLGYLLVLIGAVALIRWIHSVYIHYSTKEGVPARLARFRIVATWATAVILFAFVAYPWFTSSANLPPRVLRKQLIALATEIRDFNEDWKSKAGSPSYYKIVGIDEKKEFKRYEAERIRQQSESLKRYNAFDSQAGKVYAERFQARVFRLCKEASEAGLDIQNLDRAEIVNGLGFANISYRLSALADKIPVQ